MTIEFRPEFAASDYLKFKATQSTKRLFIDFIVMLEDFLDEGIINDEQFDRARKRILDKGNASIREMQEEIDKFDITE